jgi:hypothetical protein
MAYSAGRFQSEADSLRRSQISKKFVSDADTCTVALPYWS